MTKREEQLRIAFAAVEEQLVKAAIMITEAREERDKAEKELILTKASAEGLWLSAA